MEAESLARSIKMLKAVLDGKTYQAVAQESGVTRSAIEQRIKVLTRDLLHVVGVEGVNEDEKPTIKGMRARKDNYLEALEHYQPQHVGGTSLHALTNQDIEHAAAMIWRHSNCRNRDVALLLVLFATAAKPLEIARLEVRDYLTEDGSVRKESMMRADAAINGRERPLFFASTKLVAAMDAYLVERVRRGQGAKKSTKYRGLDPRSRLFLTDRGQAMRIRLRATGSQKHYLCGLILNIYRKIFARAGLKGVSALCARRTVARRLAERGCDIDQIAVVLGLKDRNSVRNLMPIERESLNVAVRDLV